MLLYKYITTTTLSVLRSYVVAHSTRTTVQCKHCGVFALAIKYLPTTGDIACCSERSCQAGLFPARHSIYHSHGRETQSQLPFIVFLLFANFSFSCLIKNNQHPFKTINPGSRSNTRYKGEVNTFQEHHFGTKLGQVPFIQRQVGQDQC